MCPSQTNKWRSPLTQPPSFSWHTLLTSQAAEVTRWLWKQQPLRQHIWEMPPAGWRALVVDDSFYVCMSGYTGETVRESANMFLNNTKCIFIFHLRDVCTETDCQCSLGIDRSLDKKKWDNCWIIKVNLDLKDCEICKCNSVRGAEHCCYPHETPYVAVVCQFQYRKWTYYQLHQVFHIWRRPTHVCVEIF